MNIIADENIPYVAQVFQSLGHVVTVAGRRLQANQVQDADLVLVRSVSRVDETLLKGSAVRFVATATIGTDHIDLEYLNSNNIGFSSAPGCNAISAAEYVVSSMLHLYSLQDLRKKSVAIVGCGNVGSQVLKRLSVLGVEALPHDPPRQKTLADRDYVSWEQVLDADIITAHVPLQDRGAHATRNMFGEEFFVKIKSNAVFINTSRGSVVDEAGLKKVLLQRKDLTLVLDVWQSEPAIDTELLNKVKIATPHIAGYSLDGKVRGTQMIFNSVCEYFQSQYEWSIEPLPASKNSRDIYFDTTLADGDAVRSAVAHAYDVMQDDTELRQMLKLDLSARANYFDGLRKQYRVRREFSYYRPQLQSRQKSLGFILEGLGFTVNFPGTSVEVLDEQSG